MTNAVTGLSGRSVHLVRPFDRLFVAMGDSSTTKEVAYWHRIVVAGLTSDESFRNQRPQRRLLQTAVTALDSWLGSARDPRIDWTVLTSYGRLLIEIIEILDLPQPGIHEIGCSASVWVRLK